MLTTIAVVAALWALCGIAQACHGLWREGKL